jgi:C_GCAxxG_C_C family probable redox protein
MDRGTRAIEYFNSGNSCAQSVVLAFQDRLDLSEDQIRRAASSFGSGMGRLQSTCGALTGAYMVMGLLTPVAEDKEARSSQYRKIRRFTKEFEEKHGSSICSQLTGCDFLTEEGEAIFQAKGLKQSVCAPCVKTSVGLLEKMF